MSRNRVKIAKMPLTSLMDVFTILVFFLLWRDFQKEAAMRAAFDQNALVLNEIATVIRERLPQR